MNHDPSVPILGRGGKKSKVAKQRPWEMGDVGIELTQHEVYHDFATYTCKAALYSSTMRT
jgi:hypothetical protein